MMPRSLSCPLSPLVLKFAEPVRSASPLRAPPRVFKKKPRPEGNAGRGLCGVRKCGQHRIMTSAVTAPVSGRQSVAHLRQSFRRGPQPKPSPERGLAREGIGIDTSTLADWVAEPGHCRRRNASHGAHDRGRRNATGQFRAWPLQRLHLSDRGDRDLGRGGSGHVCCVAPHARRAHCAGIEWRLAKAVKAKRRNEEQARSAVHHFGFHSLAIRRASAI